MEHIIMFSGGATSYYTAKLVVEQYGRDRCRLLFTDTLIEDKSLYKFNLQVLRKLFGIRVQSLLRDCETLPDAEENIKERKIRLLQLARNVSFTTEKMIWLQDGRTPWEVFRDKRFIGNSRIAPCSHVLKQQVARNFLEENYSPDQVQIYLGIHSSERDRFYGTNQRKGAKSHWEPWAVKSPLCDRYDVGQKTIMDSIESDGLDLPLLYKMKFSHNNCGGFCVRAGQKQFKQLLNAFPSRYSYHENQESDLREFLDTDATILTKVREGEKIRLSLKELRNTTAEDDFLSGCGCFIDPPNEVSEGQT